MNNLSVENVYTRHAAKELAKKHFWKLVAMMLIVFGVIYALTMSGTLLLAALGESGLSIALYFVLVIVAMLLGCGLSMGLLSAMIELCRGGNITVGRVFSRMGQSLKALGLSLWISLKTTLWMLPGYAMVLVSAVAVFASVDPSTGTASESITALMALLPVVGMVLIFALVVPAVLRYMLSTYILADKPETGVFESVRISKAMMKGHKWQAFKLVVPIFLVMYVIMLVAMVALSALMSLLVASEALAAVVTMVVMVALTVYFSIRMYLCYCIFYLKRCEENAPAEPAEEPAQVIESVPVE